ncbi:MAG: peptide chain release factor N(5)-glutamine methyltransferase [Burkholderiales bacterium]|nr:peptide chain release factor N(5)-glutamine methyltransferase [Burkholderiales bacterium]
MTPRSVAEALAEAHRLGLARLDAQWLMAHRLRRPRAWLVAHEDAALPADAAAELMADFARLADHVPLAYLLGESEFHGLRLRVTPDVLVPRADTETLVDWALELARPDDSLVDLGTGSGAIALALAQRLPAARMVATDLSAAALAVAQANAQRLGLTLHWAHGDWFQAVGDQCFHLVVSNPPYIANADPHLAALIHEPQVALTSGADGLDAIRRLVADAPRHLNAEGWLLLEHGWDQAEAVCSLLRDAGFASVQSRRDPAQRARCSGGRWPG